MKSSLDNLIRKAGIQGINFYQKNISPHKGYSCAHRVLHGGDSCSEYAKKMLLNHSIQDSITYSQQRFRDCAQAEKKLKKHGYLTTSQSSSLPILSRRKAIALMVPLFVLGFATPALARGGRMGARGCQTMSENSNYENDENDSEEAFWCGFAVVAFSLCSGVIQANENR